MQFNSHYPSGQSHHALHLFIFVKLMQQIAMFDVQLNYVPYRYRGRSNTNPKRTADVGHCLSYSKGKKQKFNPEKNNQYPKIDPFTEEYPRRTMTHEQVDATDHESQHFSQEQKKQFQQRQKQQESDSPKRKLPFAAQQKHSQQTTPSHDQNWFPKWSPSERNCFNDEQNRKEEITNNYKQNRQHHQASDLSQENALPEYENKEAHGNSIFNESDLQQIKAIILENLQQSENEAKSIVPSSGDEKQEEKGNFNLSTQNDSKPIDNVQHLTFESRYERLRALNQAEAEKHQFNRSLKRMEIIEKASKVQRNFKNARGAGSKQVQSSNTRVLQQKLKRFVPIIEEKQPQQKKGNSPAQKYEPLKVNIIEKKPSQKSLSKQASKLDRERQEILKSNNSQTSNSSHTLHQESHLKSVELQTSDSYKRLIKEKQPISFQRKYYEQYSKQTNIRQKYNPDNQNMKEIINAPDDEPFNQRQQEKEPKEGISQILSQFTRQSPNEIIIKQLKIAKSKEKDSQMPINAYINSRSLGYSHPKVPLGYGIKNTAMSTEPSYAMSMKKKKQKAITLQIQRESISQEVSPKPCSSYSPQTEQSKHFSPMQYIKYEPIQHHSIRQTENQPSDQSYSSRGIETHKKSILHPFSKSLNRIDSEIVFMKSEQEYQYDQQYSQCKHISQKQSGNSKEMQSNQKYYQDEPNERVYESGRESEPGFSQPTSRVHERRNNTDEHSSILKSEDGDELLKLMVLNSDMKELSSLMMEQKSPEMNNLSAISHQLCEVINSNQSECSITPTPQNISLSSSSIHYNFESPDDEGNFDLREVFARQSEAKPSRQVDESKYEQINDGSMILHDFPAAAHFPEGLMINLQSVYNKDKFEEQEGLQLNINSRRTNQAQMDQNSIRQYRNHFHPSDALRKFKHAKHNSADFSQKTLRSARINHSLSTLKRRNMVLEIGERKKSRKDKNMTRFKTRMTDN